MKRTLLRIALAATFVAAPALAAAKPVTTEYYYRIKWGSFEEFKELYARNHAPILKELQKLGFITAMRMESPFTHLAGGPRWDLRVTVTFKDADGAVGTSDAYDAASKAIIDRLYPDKAKFDAEERRRFEMLEDHWDVIVMSEE